MATAPSLLVLEARFYAKLADDLLRGVERVVGADGYERVTVPGAFELPAALAFASQGGGYDGFIALGCVIRGETSHYEHVCQECARGLQDVAVQQRLALGFGVLTVENREQARRRADPDDRDAGGGAAWACLHMIDLRSRLQGQG